MLLTPVGTVAKSAEHEVAHRVSPIPGAVSAESQVDAVIDWWKDKGLTRKILVFIELTVSCEVLVILPGLQEAAWAPVAPSETG